MNAGNARQLDSSDIAFPQRWTEALERLQATLGNSTSESIYVYDLVSQQTLWSSKSIGTLLGYTSDELKIMGSMGLANLIYPNDITRVSDHYQRFVTLKSGDVITIKYRMRQANGTWCCLLSQETTLLTSINGFPLNILGVLQIINPDTGGTLEPCEQLTTA